MSKNTLKSYVNDSLKATLPDFCKAVLKRTIKRRVLVVIKLFYIKMVLYLMAGKKRNWRRKNTQNDSLDNR